MEVTVRQAGVHPLSHPHCPRRLGSLFGPGVGCSSGRRLPTSEVHDARDVSLLGGLDQGSTTAELDIVGVSPDGEEIDRLRHVHFLLESDALLAVRRAL